MPKATWSTPFVTIHYTSKKGYPYRQVCIGSQSDEGRFKVIQYFGPCVTKGNRQKDIDKSLQEAEEHLICSMIS